VNDKLQSLTPLGASRGIGGFSRSLYLSLRCRVACFATRGLTVSVAKDCLRGGQMLEPTSAGSRCSCAVPRLRPTSARKGRGSAVRGQDRTSVVGWQDERLAVVSFDPVRTSLSRLILSHSSLRKSGPFGGARAW
jgi:hypothetical protein